MNNNNSDVDAVLANLSGISLCISPLIKGAGDQNVPGFTFLLKYDDETKTTTTSHSNTEPSSSLSDPFVPDKLMCHIVDTISTVPPAAVITSTSTTTNTNDEQK